MAVTGVWVAGAGGGGMGEGAAASLAGGVGAATVALLAVEFFQQVVCMARLAHHQANLVLDIHRFGKRAKVQPDHGFFKPVTGLLQDFVVGHATSSLIESDRSAKANPARATEPALPNHGGMTRRGGINGYP